MSAQQLLIRITGANLLRRGYGDNVSHRYSGQITFIGDCLDQPQNPTNDGYVWKGVVVGEARLEGDREKSIPYV
jgi:hypothetical protein